MNLSRGAGRFWNGRSLAATRLSWPLCCRGSPITDTSKQPDKSEGCAWIACHGALLLSVWWGAVVAFPVATNIYLLLHSSSYVDTTFTVDSVRYSRGGTQGVDTDAWWADGIISHDNSRQRCSLIADFPNVRTREELRKTVPVGTKFTVKYNQNMTDMLVQGASPRVIINDDGAAFASLRSSTIRYLVLALFPLAVFSVLVQRVRRAAGSGPLFPWRLNEKRAT